MTSRLAGVFALLVFAVCLLVGGLGADNTFATTVERALTAMMATLVVGAVVGVMARKMLEENLKSQQEKLKKSAAPTPPPDR